MNRAKGSHLRKVYLVMILLNDDVQLYKLRGENALWIISKKLTNVVF